MTNDPYCFEGIRVLTNLLDLRTAGALRRFERTMTELRAGAALEFADQAQHLDQAALRGIHRVLFQDVFVWAGVHRTIDISKGGEPFAPVRALYDYADRHILPVFWRKSAAAGDDQAFATALAECWGELNAFHPFREGNGRATQIFVQALARRHGRDIDWSKVSREEEIAAAKASFRQDYGLYQELLERALNSSMFQLCRSSGS